MDCRQARDALIAAAERPLPDAEREDVAAHLAGCAACRRFASGAHGWRGAHRGRNSGFVAGGSPAAAPDLTERVLASVRPLPPPWVYEESRRRKRSHVAGLVVAAVGATLAFVTVSVALVVAVASDGPVPARSANPGPFPRLATEAVVDANMRGWFGSLTTDAARFALTFALLLLLAAGLLRWLRAVAARVGHDE